jgi:diguanylate cyclase (GGDEF)-like protein/PAS domain S-box-containing protein
VLVQTPDSDALEEDQGAVGGFVTPVAWSEVDGAVAILTAVGARYLQQLREAGKAVVLASMRMPDFEAPIALPNNHGGTFTAVEHLIGHGHTRIGFVGNLAEQDVRDRHAAYLEALETHGLTVDPRLVFAAPDNVQTGGALAARDVLASVHRPSALMVATDHNAIGLMRTLTDAGVSIPGDIAVVGFDNIEAGSFSTPMLTSVNQRFDEVGALAGRLVLAQMRGEVVPSTDFTSPSVVLAVRNSCGCAADTPGATSGGDEWLLDASPELLRDELQDVLCGALLTGAGVVDSPLRDAVLTTVREAERLLQAGDDVTSAEIGALTTSLHRLTQRPDTLRRITAAMIEYVERIGSSGAPAAGSPSPGAAARIAAALWRLQAGAFLRQAESTEAALEEQYVVDAGLLDAGRSDPRHLGWLAGTHVGAGVLALWEDSASSGQLQVVGAYDPYGLLPNLIGSVMTPQCFPPTALIGAAQPADRGVCVVMPVRTKERDWGMLAVVGAIDTTSARETHQHWAALLCASLESERLQEAVRASEERYSLMTRATNDGLWEWEARTGNVYLSDRCCTLLGLESCPQAEHLAQWKALVHPDDRAHMERGMQAAGIGPQTVNSEYRLRTVDGSYRWMLARAIGVRSENGPVERIVGSLSDIHERRSLEDQLRENALYDAVTRLPNRRLFLDRLERSVALWHRSGTPFAVIFLDLDGFKLINDSLGHQMGDRVLTAVGTRIQHELREVDTGARFGGDEFAILLHDLEDASVLMVTQRVQASLGKVIDLDGHELSIQASLGIATSAIDYASADDVLRDADTAMYHAKGTERGTVSFFDTAMHARAVHQQTLHTELRRALKEHQFEMHYQPIVTLATGRTDRFEALVRWRHPERGLLLPDEFLTIMQEVGLIVQLGQWIIDEVCRQLAVWGPSVLNVSINVSDREFWHNELLAHVLRSLRRHSLTPERLTLEITEGVIMRRPDVALCLMQEMHDAGLLLHIDDFGTGYSSLETLHRFPVDAFKIDRSFIRSLATGDRGGELVRTIVAMGKALGLAVVAEGIETDAQLAFLREVGCATGQGFLFMPAVTGEDAPDLLERTLGTGHPQITPTPLAPTHP